MISIKEDIELVVSAPKRRRRRRRRKKPKQAMISVAYYHFVHAKINKRSCQSAKHRLERLDILLDKKQGRHRWCDGLRLAKEHYRAHKHVYVRLFPNHWVALDQTGFLGGYTTRKQAWANLEKILKPRHHAPIYLVHTKASVVSWCDSSQSKPEQEQELKREELDCLFLELTSLKRGYVEIDWSKKKRLYSSGNHNKNQLS